ncbi:unnamed protein product [Phaeothamnion confervicola]
MRSWQPNASARSDTVHCTLATLSYGRPNMNGAARIAARGIARSSVLHRGCNPGFRASPGLQRMIHSQGPRAAPVHDKRGRIAVLAMGVAGAATCAAAAILITVTPSGQRKETQAVGAYQIPIGKDAPREVNCFIEVGRGSRMKYEWDDELSMLKLDRVLHSAVFYPHDYGFIPATLCGDGDPLDVLVLGTSALQPGSIVDVIPIAYMLMEDEKGLDEKVLAVPAKDPRFAEIRSLRDVPEHYLREISHFFETYKALERQKWVRVGGWKGTEDTHNLIRSTHKAFLDKQKALAEKDYQTAAAAAAPAAPAAAP